MTPGSNVGSWLRSHGARALAAAALFTTLAATGCLHYGFAGGGLPQHIKTVAVLPFDNETSAAGLQQQLFDRLSREVQGRLGLHAASEARADAIVRGRITGYEEGIPASYSADPSQSTSARRRLTITIDVSIVDQTSGRTLWERKALTAQGDYAEGAQDAGRRDAIEKLVTEVINGAQSQW